jgi:recombination protein RecT
MNELSVPINQYLTQPDVNKYLTQLLGERKGQFVVAMTTIVNGNASLLECDKKSLVAVGLTAVGMNLSMSPSLGHCFPVPYRNSDGSKSAQFQMGWKGFIQLALRTGQYQFINVSEVYQNQFVSFDKFNEVLNADFTIDGKGKVVGCVAKFILTSGFKKTLFWKTEAIQAHGQKYSKSYASGQWTKDFDGMARKTLLKQLISKFGLMSTELEEAITKDQGVLDIDFETGAQTIKYEDNPQPNVVPVADADGVVYEDTIDVTPQNCQVPVTPVTQTETDINKVFIPDVQYRVEKASLGATKTGKKFTKILLKESGHFLEVFDYETHELKEGDFIIIKAMRPIQSREYNGRTYYSTSATIDVANNLSKQAYEEDDTELPFPMN